MSVKCISKWTCNCLCGCGKIEFGEVRVDYDDETEAMEPRRGWAEMPKNITMCPECWNNIGKTGCTTIDI